MPTPATPDADQPDASDTVDHEEAARAARALVDDGLDALMINGTFGEAATLTNTEWQEFTRTVVEAVDSDVPVVAGPTTLNTRDTIDRAKFARDIGADGIMLGRPMWCELSFEATIQFYRDVAEKVPELGIVVYHNPSAFKNTLTPDYWEALAEIPQVAAAKYGTIDAAYRDCVDAADGRIQMMTIEKDWFLANKWFPDQATACWSSSVACGPKPVVRLRNLLLGGEIEAARDLTDRIEATYEPFFPKDMQDFRRHTISLEKIRMNAAGYLEAGPTRPPYHVTPKRFLEGARESGRQWARLVEDIDG
ncbi:dihydrodipicolinate synthase family protein [Halobellus rufus]|uniref:dihydrodipicolinate synthase family protein n=1 Tax=Halobellus rufus TaxID=1448860 RepID=UPI0018CD019B|nr:dihydrodipicolinate synthase family protein [Halobellus rufus]